MQSLRTILQNAYQEIEREFDKNQEEISTLIKNKIPLEQHFFKKIETIYASFNQLNSGKNNLVQYAEKYENIRNRCINLFMKGNRNEIGKLIKLIDDNLIVLNNIYTIFNVFYRSTQLTRLTNIEILRLGYTLQQFYWRIPKTFMDYQLKINTIQINFNILLQIRQNQEKKLNEFTLHFQEIDQLLDKCYSSILEVKQLKFGENFHFFEQLIVVELFSLSEEQIKDLNYLKDQRDIFSDHAKLISYSFGKQKSILSGTMLSVESEINKILEITEKIEKK